MKRTPALVSLLVLAVLVASFFLVRFLVMRSPQTDSGAETGPLLSSYGATIELQGNSWPVDLGSPAAGVLEAGYDEYEFVKVREGEEFHYLIDGLEHEVYDLELSFREYLHDAPGQRVFGVSAGGIPLEGLSDLDIFSKAGHDVACRLHCAAVKAPGGRLDLCFKADRGLAMVSHIRLLRDGAAEMEIDVGESRRWTYLPLRFCPDEKKEVHEVILGRLGSRFMINPLPQLLAWRQSPLGTWTDDFSELILAFRDEEGDIRCLPFSDRYPLFETIRQELSVTGVAYRCSDPSLPFEVELSFEAPFYPGDVKLSSAPFFYLDIEISSTDGGPVRGEMLLARPHKDDNTGEDAPRGLGGEHQGYVYSSRYTYGDESHVIDDCNSGYWEFEEALAVDETDGITWHYSDIRSNSWIWDSPEGYPPPYPHKVYTFVPRGYSGFERKFEPEAGRLDNLTIVLACHGGGGVLEVLGDDDYRFQYGNPSGPGLASVEDVVDYALGSERAAIEERTACFDGIFSEPYLSTLSDEGRDLTAVALQSFLANTWWCYSGSDPSREWFSVWEGDTYMYHSSVDVEYTNAWFYLYFWPDLLKRLLLEWPLFEKEGPQGRYLSHDMGIEHRVNGMAYPHDMTVEENADYILLLHAYWKHTGDTGLMRELCGKARDYTRCLLECDTDGDGLPDTGTSNTIDQGSPAVQNSRNQTYLGVKVLAACRAAREMEEAQERPEPQFIAECDERVKLINRSLEGSLWLGDHFCICDDPSVPDADREAYSIYAPSGLLYLLSSGIDVGLTPSNLERLRGDMSASAAATSRRYGCVHTSANNENQWVSQNLWRDAIGYWLEVEGWPEGQHGRTAAYWDLERYFATFKSGSFWDVCAYNPGREERHGIFRGAFLPDHALDQSLGYYSRGVAVLALVGSSARLRLDRVEDRLLFHPAHFPCRVPVLQCADWGAEDPCERVPVLVFDGSGMLEETVNGGLLPSGVHRAVLGE